jgi:ABC-type transport system involved in cytochrome bd biosynthesis fused ATPase/permease subunit
MRRSLMQASIAALIVAIVVAVTLLIALVADGSQPSTERCKEALRNEYHAALVAGVQGTRPEACNGIDDATLGRLASEIIEEEAGR